MTRHLLAPSVSSQVLAQSGSEQQLDLTSGSAELLRRFTTDLEERLAQPGLRAERLADLGQLLETIENH